MAAKDHGMKSLSGLPARSRDGILVVVETPAGSRSKLKYLPELGQVALSRPLPLGLHYPFDWGFVPSTRAPDGDPLDAMVYGTGTGQAGTVVVCRPLGVLLLEQNRKSGPGRERNDRLLVLPLRAAHGQRPGDVFDLPEQMRTELEDFFLWSTKSEKKDIRLLGWGGVDEAERLLAEAERLAGS
jgi:inorganic pyrophosphatase